MQIEKTNKEISRYQKLIQHTPIYPCAIFQRLHFKDNICTVNEATILAIRYFESLINFSLLSTHSKICKFCKKELNNERMPTYASPSQIHRNILLPSVSALTSLEERLVSSRTTFAQVRQLVYKRTKLGITRTIINVPADLDKIQLALPRNLEKETTVQKCIPF